MQQAHSSLVELQQEVAAQRAEAANRTASAQDELRPEAGDLPEGLTVPPLPDISEDDAVRAALLTDTTLRELRDGIERHGIDRARLSDGLAEPGIAEAETGTEALERATRALEDATRLLTEATAAARTAQGAAGSADRAAQRTREALASLHAAVAEASTVRERAGTTVRVADLATGTSADGDRIRLSTFVLMRRFEDVVLAANARLSRFAGTDLELVRDTSGRGARRTGLDLLVVDRRTDQSRAPETLSGGETFYVSLALALGLADIVTAEAGGVQMQTLFIDEGFGSLDPERLESVIAEVGRLADAGRTVGIVSHVTELKGQIPEQIHVRRREDRTSGVTVTA